MTPYDMTPSIAPDSYDPSECKTQLFIDRDVELLRCDEEKQCPYKHHYNNMVICDCPVTKH